MPVRGHREHGLCLTCELAHVAACWCTLLLPAPAGPACTAPACQAADRGGIGGPGALCCPVHLHAPVRLTLHALCQVSWARACLRVQRGIAGELTPALALPASGWAWRWGGRACRAACAVPAHMCRPRFPDCSLSLKGQGAAVRAATCGQPQPADLPVGACRQRSGSRQPEEGAARPRHKRSSSGQSGQGGHTRQAQPGGHSRKASSAGSQVRPGMSATPAQQQSQHGWLACCERRLCQASHADGTAGQRVTTAGWACPWLGCCAPRQAGAA